jgi:hypothetical protein
VESSRENVSGCGSSWSIDDGHRALDAGALDLELELEQALALEWELAHCPTASWTSLYSCD